MRGMTFAAGPGAYREDGFDELFNRKPWDSEWVAANTPACTL